MLDSILVPVKDKFDVDGQNDADDCQNGQHDQDRGQILRRFQELAKVPFFSVPFPLSVRVQKPDQRIPEEFILMSAPSKRSRKPNSFFKGHPPCFVKNAAKIAALHNLRE